MKVTDLRLDDLFSYASNRKLKLCTGIKIHLSADLLSPSPADLYMIFFDRSGRVILKGSDDISIMARLVYDNLILNL